MPELKSLVFNTFDFLVRSSTCAGTCITEFEKHLYKRVVVFMSFGIKWLFLKTN